ncbi:uncharacterized protein LOC129775711 [Toxorhynchites rutilus septentrionalis]|uniref:uncharacterized protein LOC129775711 n=1 Tax=Toxorhynchites rutilus septentrionalis TaxID=329112 RepID=UPI00247B0B32|nr:uncharacterized protein LOC129775711 [Toxorhynchites rutilus septentrionalis]
MRLMRMVETIVVMVLFVGIISPVQVMYEGFSQTNGSEVVEFDMRVRKINRTTAALNGKATIKEDLTNKFICQADALHSPKGNNQYNVYPMKISPTGLCNFTNKVWSDYHPYFERYSEDMMQIDECPVLQRVVLFKDMIVDKKMFPRYIPSGLWRILVQCSEDMGRSFGFEMKMKAYEDGYF